MKPEMPTSPEVWARRSDRTPASSLPSRRSRRSTSSPTRSRPRSPMHRVRVGLVADPAKPSEVARRIRDAYPPEGDGGQAWDIEVVSEPFTVGSEDVGTALNRLADHAHERQWDLVIGITELPL